MGGPSASGRFAGRLGRTKRGTARDSKAEAEEEFDENRLLPHGFQLAGKNPNLAESFLSVLLYAADWVQQAEDMIRANRDRPKTLQELMDGIGKKRPGYDYHHIIEQTAAERWGLTRSEIDDPSNLVSIPRLKHYQITGWYATKSDRFGSLSPREYLSDKGPEERRRIGLDALRLFEVLKP